MTRIVFATMILGLFSLSATAQVKIHVPQKRQKKYETIRASIENTGSKPVTFCVEVGQTSSTGGSEIEPTPFPFSVQRNNGGKWNTLLIGPDVGSFQKAEILDAGKSLEFAFRLSDSGQMRLRLEYWRGLFPSLDCRAPSKGAKAATSTVFNVD